MVALRLVTSLALLSSVSSPRLYSRVPHASSSASQPPLPRRHTSFQQRGTVVTAFSSSSGAPMPLTYPRPTVLEPKAGGKPTAAIFIMHGLGDTAVREALAAAFVAEHAALARAGWGA